MAKSSETKRINVTKMYHQTDSSGKNGIVLPGELNSLVNAKWTSFRIYYHRNFSSLNDLNLNSFKC